MYKNTSPMCRETRQAGSEPEQWASFSLSCILLYEGLDEWSMEMAGEANESNLPDPFQNIILLLKAGLEARGKDMVKGLK